MQRNLLFIAFVFAVGALRVSVSAAETPSPAADRSSVPRRMPSGVLLAVWK